AYFPKGSPVFLAIDTEGLDLAILQDIDWTRWRPAVVQAEPSERFSPGAEKAMVRFMQQKDYILAARTDVNLIFVDRETLRAPSAAYEPQDGAVEEEAHFVSPRSRYDETCSVGIVTRTKDRAVLLRRALESVKNQTYPHWRLVVVNDGGDPTPVDELIGAAFEGDERVNVIHHAKSKGMEAASVAGLALLDTDLAAIHDDDDSWAPDMLAIATKVLRDQNAKMPSVRGVVTRVNWVDEIVTGNHIKINQIRPWQEHDKDCLTEGLIDLSRLAVKNLFPPIGFIFDLSVCRQIGAFDSSLPVLGDWDFHLRFCLKHDVWVHPELLAFYHLRHSASGALGNTVIAGKSKHIIYNTYLRNSWLRESAKDQAGQIMLHGYNTKLDYIEQLLKHSNPIAAWALKKKKQKTGIAAFLSDLNRKRKALRRKRS
ncbi:MAG: glycosyltransferase, partial [Boseongicola sp.]